MSAHGMPFRVTATTLFVALVFLIPAALTSSAEPITVRFTVIPDPTDPVNLRPSDGTFTFDSGLIPEGGGFVMDDTGQLASDIAFDWGSTSWTEANAGVVALRFDQNGGLRHFRMAGATNGLLGIYHTPEDDFWLTSPLMGYRLFGQQFDGFYLARVTSPDVAVPEPGSLFMLGTGAVYLLRRRTQRSL